VSTERRTGWAIFDKKTGEMSMSARWSHAKACLYAGHEVLRVSFYRVVPDIGEDETEADNAERVETLSDCMQCGQFREHGHKCGGKS
jgi:hypothetical protein